MLQESSAGTISSVSGVLQCFLQACFEQNPDKALALIAEDFTCALPDVQETVQSREEFSLLFKKITVSDCCAAAYEISDHSEKPLPGGSILSLCRLSTRSPQQNTCAELPELRLTAGFVPENGQFRISFIHASVMPDAVHPSVRIPLSFLEEQTEIPDAELQALFSNLNRDFIPGGLLGISLERGYPPLLVSDGLLLYLGYTRESFLSAANGSLLSVIHTADRRTVIQALAKAERAHQDLRFCCRFRKQDGSYAWVSYLAKKLVLRDGHRTMIGAISDISEMVYLQERLERESTLDPLTQVYNRREAQRLIEHDLAVFGSGALLILALDPFEAFLAACGRLEGDAILIRLSHLLKDNIRSDDIVARLSENEFIIYLHNVWRREDVVLQAQRLYRVIQDSFREQPLKFGLSLSAGGILAPRGQTFAASYDAANQMLQQSRQAAPSEPRIRIY